MRLCRVVTAIIPSPYEWMMRFASCNQASDLLEIPTSDCFASLVDDWNALITASPIP